jgi:hypothetical protein
MLNVLNQNGLSGPTSEKFPITKATQAEAVAGSDNRKFMTPLRTKQAVDVAVDHVLPEAIDTAMAAASPVFDDVVSVQTLPQPGESGKLYIVGADAYHWNGTDYDPIGVPSSFISPTPPAAATIGAIWINSENYRTHVFQAGVWVEISTV